MHCITTLCIHGVVAEPPDAKLPDPYICATTVACCIVSLIGAQSSNVHVHGQEELESRLRSSCRLLHGCIVIAKKGSGLIRLTNVIKHRDLYRPSGFMPRLTHWSLSNDAHTLVCALQSYYGGLQCVAWSPDGRYIATGGEDDLVSIYGMAERGVVAWGEGHSSWVMQVAFVPWYVPDHTTC